MNDTYHSFVANGLFLGKGAFPNIMPAIAFLSTQVKDPTKLSQVMDYLTTTVHDGLKLKANLNIITNWFIDAAFVVYSDYRSHTGAFMALRKRVITSVSTKQKINTQGSTESELVSTDDITAKL